ncbi:MAG: flagellar assembly protein FliW [Lachnospiraceae bacterium]|nr:flagellar assembly protein FliW [Lachnospiraceae bacterium]
MVINTRHFNEVNVDEEKMIVFEGGIIGFPELQRFVLIHDEEKNDGAIRWLQSVDEPQFAMPVIDPLAVKPDYNPQVEDEMLKRLGEFKEDDLLVLVTITVPSDLTKMTVNLKAPLVINSSSKKACQIIVEDYEVKFPIYDIVKKNKKEGE